MDFAGFVRAPLGMPFLVLTGEKASGIDTTVEGVQVIDFLRLAEILAQSTG